jgi:hypothetical protein
MALRFLYLALVATLRLLGRRRSFAPDLGKILEVRDEGTRRAASLIKKRLVLDWWDAAERFVQPLVIVDADPVGVASVVPRRHLVVPGEARGGRGGRPCPNRATSSVTT